MLSNSNAGAGPTLQGYQVILRPVVESDLEKLRFWRNDPEISRHMISQSNISKEQQLAWFKKIQRDSSQLHFIISYKGEDIGSANIKAKISGHSVSDSPKLEPGLYIADSRYRSNILAFSPTLLLNDYCFEHLRCDKLVAFVKSENIAALKYNEKLGYKVLAKGDLIEIELNISDYQQHTKVLKRLLSRG